MNCLFVHDFRSYIKNGNVYTTNLSYEILTKRYVDCFGELKILNRCGQMSITQDENSLVKASGKSIEFLNEINIFTPFSFFRDYLTIKKKVCKYVEQSEYIIIRLDSFMGYIAAEYCRKHNKKYLIEVVGCVWDSFWNRNIGGKLIAFPLFKKMQYEIKNAPYVIYVTSQFLQKRYPTTGKNTNISNVQIKKLQPYILEKRIERINKINNIKNIFNIVTIASIDVRYKGQETVIKALAELKKMGIKNFRYHLIGGGKNAYLNNLAKKLNVCEQVIFHGSMNHNKVIEFLDQCDIYIQPSKQEGLPRALIEAMSRGLLCYGTNIAGIPELLPTNMLISTKRKNYIELVNKLLKIDKYLCIEQAKRNFTESQKYEESILDKRRQEFFINFKEQSIMGNK